MAVWAYVIAKTRKSVVELHPTVMATIIGCTESEIRDAIEVLCAPDAASTNPEHEGRRLLKRGPFEYFVVSWEHYNSIRNEEERRIYNREKQKEHRAKVKKSLTVIDKSNESAMSANADADSEASSETDSKPRRAPRRRPSASKSWRTVPEDWNPSPESIAEATALGVDVDLELRRFRENRYKTPKKNANTCWEAWYKQDFAIKRKPTQTGFQQKSASEGWE